MPWQCRLVEKPANKDRQVGDMWYVDPTLMDERWRKDWEEKLSADYLTNHRGKRLPLIVQTPVGPWCVDHKSTSGGVGWTITGEPPNITATPSINFVGAYHGWLQNGVLSDDCEGRAFPPMSGTP